MKQKQQLFLPGSEWVYFKLYTGLKTADKVLFEISDIVDILLTSNQIKKWFFIRYSDPDFHLRIRMLLNDKQCIGPVINLFHERLQPLVNNHLIWKIQLDTYNRELERYGNESIEEAESIFCIDSACIVLLLRKLQENENEDYRWIVALKLIDVMLSNFSYDDISKKELLFKLNNSFKNEFGFNKYNSKQFNSNYRYKKNLIENALGDSINDSYLLSLYSPIGKMSETLLPIINELKRKIKINKQDTLDSLLSSYIHMSLNRLFRSKNRAHELIIYDMMYRYYDSMYARKKYNRVDTK